MYCQSCGASNSDDAKFCNQCGGRIARPGDAGGPAPMPPGAPRGPGATAVGIGAPSVASAPIAPPSAPAVNVWEQQQTSGSGGGPSMMSVSLDTIGVRSTKKVWAGIALVALLLVGLGALGSWLLRGEPEVVAEAGHAQPEDPFVIGTPLPPGELPTTPVEPPVEPSDSTGSAMTSGSTMTGTSMTGSTTMTSTTSGTTSGTTRTGTSGTTSMTVASGTGGGDTSTMGSTGTSGTATDTSMDTAMDTSTSMDTSTDTSSMESSTGSSADSSMGSATDSSMDTGTVPNLGGELPEERDLELELYGSRVRFVVQRYYAARAQTCFDRATRNNPSVSGTVVVNMTIGADGNVSDTSVARNTTGDEVLGNCLRSQVASWQLPPPPGGSLQMQMPFSR